MKKVFKFVTLFAALLLASCNAPAEDNNQESKADATTSEQASSSSKNDTSSAHKHSWGSWEVNQPKACVEGTRTRSCSGCDEVQTEKVPAGPHTFGELQVDTPATCKEGVAKRVCSVCGAEDSTAILPTEDHAWAASSVDHTKGSDEVTATFEECPSCEQTRISWNAQDSAKVASSGFNSSGKFGAAGDYVQYKFYSPKALKARLYVKIADRSGSSDSPYNRSEKTGNQSIWYDYYNGPEFKYTVTMNNATIDQNAQANVMIGSEVVALSEFMYSDFKASSSATELVAPWFTFNTVEGLNTIKIERTLGYSVSVKEFYVIGA